MVDVNQISLNFNPTSLKFLNAVLGFIMFGIALDMKASDFKNIVAFPRAAFVGLLNQYILFPALTFGLVWVMRPPPSMALGMFLVAACPGGNISNFLTHFAKGNTALSVCITGTSTVASVLMTPFLFGFWSSLYPPAAPLLKSIAINPMEMFGSIFILLGLPLALGIFLAHRYPELAEKLKKPFRIFAGVFFALFILGAFVANWAQFLHFVSMVFFLILIHNGLALTIGYASARVAKLPEADRRAVAIEIAIHNTGLGLILIFAFFGGMGGMALVAAWWGVWDVIAGLTVAAWWRRHV